MIGHHDLRVAGNGNGDRARIHGEVRLGAVEGEELVGDRREISVAVLGERQARQPERIIGRAGNAIRHAAGDLEPLVVDGDGTAGGNTHGGRGPG